MRRLVLLFPLVLALVPPAAAVRTAYSCSAVGSALGYLSRTGWYLSAVVPSRADVAVIVTGDGAPPNEWTGVSLTSRQGPNGIIDSAFVTTLFTTSGVALVQLVDVHGDGSFTPITSCPLTIT